MALIVDLCTRAIVGWAVSRHCDAALAQVCLSAAVARHRPPPGLLHHTDRGSTCTAADYRTLMHSFGMVASMSRKGNCWDNAVAESTFGTIKTELFADLTVPEGLHEVRTMLFTYIESFYNRRRLHSSLDYMTPDEKQRLLLGARRAA